MRIKSEDDILKQEIRAQIILEIEAPENIERKMNHYRRHQCFKDQTAQYVRDNLLKQLDRDTVTEMEYAISNISIAKKIVNKLAKVYSCRVTRYAMINDTKSDVDQTSVDYISKYISIDTTMKTINRLLRLHLNCAAYVKPCPVLEGNAELYDIVVEALSPYLYDVVENHYNRTKPMVYILSNFSPMNASRISTSPETHSPNGTSQLSTIGNKKDELIADNKEDENSDSKEYIFWTKNYHFTTDKKGIITSDASNVANPIGELPLENFSADQDNSFWAVGGDDLLTGAVLINSLLSHINHIAISQGYGQFYMTGKNLPKNQKIGPTKGIILEHEKDDPVPTLGFLNANPQITELLKLVETYAALLLSTNNLSTAGVTPELGKANTFPSAISLMIDKAESLEDSEEQKVMFENKEPNIWRKISKWQSVYAGQLVPELAENIISDSAKVTINFGHQMLLQTEAEKLANIEKRKSLGINTAVDLIKIDQPELSDDQAMQKLLAITAEKIQRMADSVLKPGGDKPTDQKVSDGNKNNQDNGEPIEPVL
jgi:hypothetical protein